MGVTHTHPRMWEWHVQQLIQEDVRAMKKRRWLVRLGLDEQGLGAVMVAEEVDEGEHYHLTVGAIASRLRRTASGQLADEMMEDMFGEIGARCVDAGFSGDVRLTAMIHRDNFASKRMCERNGLAFDGPTSDTTDHEDWSRNLPIPEPPLFDDLNSRS